MSTHFRPLPPRAPPPPSSPVRPSTAHSTIRAVTPSPPGTANEAFRPRIPLPRPKSEHALGPAELATYARYIVKAEEGDFNDSPGLRRGGAVSGRSSPLKRRSGSVSPRKRPYSTPPGLTAYGERRAKEKDEVVSMAQDQRGVGKSVHGGEGEEDAEESAWDEDEDKCPDTPTPMTREQKRHAYVPLGAPLRAASTAPKPLPADGPISLLEPHQPPPPAVSRKPIPSSQQRNRMSVSGQSKLSAISAASKHSIFSTPGRDELERKKALVEVDEGPFARVQSMMDLDKERRRISSGGKLDQRTEQKERKGLGIKCGCVVM